jgi:hypothetical protein
MIIGCDFHPSWQQVSWVKGGANVLQIFTSKQES